MNNVLSLRPVCLVAAGALCAICATTGPAAAADLARADLSVDRLFDPRYLSIANRPKSPAIGAASTGSSDAYGPGRLVTRICGKANDDAGPCDVKVFYEVQQQRDHHNSCGILVSDVTVMRRNVDRIVWKLHPDPGPGNPEEPGSKRLEFIDAVEIGNEPIRGIHFRDLDDDPDGSTPAGDRHDVLSGAKRNSPVEFEWSVNRKYAGQPKAHYYAIVLRRWNKDAPPKGQWEDCDPYDPVVINRG